MPTVSKGTFSTGIFIRVALDESKMKYVLLLIGVFIGIELGNSMEVTGDGNRRGMSQSLFPFRS